MKTGIAIIGVGRWGVHLLRNFQQHPQAQVIAIVDSHPEKLKAAQEKLGLAEGEILTATSWEEIRELETLDAIVVATPASTHYPLILDALNLGYHVLAEKPLTLDPEECQELCQLAAEKQLQLIVDHTYIFNPVVEKGKEIVQSGQLGELRYGYASRTNLGPVRQDVDALWDLAVHDIAIFNSWLGAKPTHVQAEGKIWLQPEREIPISTRTDGLADLAWVKLLYASGFTAYIHLCWLNPDKQRRLTVVGAVGSLIFDEMAAETPLVLQHGHFEQQDGYFIPTGVEKEAIPVTPQEPLQKVCNHFLTQIQSPSSSLSSGWVGTELVEILTGLTHSLVKGGKLVQLPVS